MENQEEQYPAEWFAEAISRERAWLSEAHELIRKLQGDVAALSVPKDDKGSLELIESSMRVFGDSLLDGNTDEATKSFMDALKVHESRMESLIERTANRVLAEFEESFLLRQAIKRIEQAIPQLNPASESYEAGAVGDIRSLMRGYVENDGQLPCAALEKATRRLYGSAFQEIGSNTRIGTTTRDGLNQIRFCLSKDGRFIIA